MGIILSTAALADYLDFPTLLKRYPVARSTILRAVNEGRFPAPRQINGRTRWLIAELDQYDAREAAILEVA